MREGWGVKIFDDVVASTLIGIVRNNKEQSLEFTYRYFKMSNIRNDNGIDESSYTFINATEDEVEKYSLKENDFLFNTRNSFELVGKTCLYKSENDAPTLFNNNILRVRFKDFLLPQFAAYAFSSSAILNDLEKMKSGTTSVVGIYYKSLKNLPIPIPPLPEQKQIVAILDKAFAAIDQAKANIEKNIQNAKDLFKSIMLKRFTDGIELNKWPLEKLSKYNQVVVGYVGPISKAYTDSENGVLLLSTKNVSSNGITLDKLTRVEKPFHDKNKKSQLRSGDILVSRHGNSGESAVIPETILAAHALNVIIIKKSDELNSEYISYLLNSGVLSKITESKTGSIQEIINTSVIKNLFIPVPTESEQFILVDELTELAQKTEAIEATYLKKAKELDELKKSILQKAFAGELSEAGLSGLEDKQDLKGNINQVIL